MSGRVLGVLVPARAFYHAFSGVFSFEVALLMLSMKNQLMARSLVSNRCIDTEQV